MDALRIAEHLLGRRTTTAQMLNNLAALLADRDDHTAFCTIQLWSYRELQHPMPDVRHTNHNLLIQPAITE